MKSGVQIPEPFLFNPLKHHLGFIRQYVDCNSAKTYGNINRLGECTSEDIRSVIREMKHLGTSVMDVYSGDMNVESICSSIVSILGDRKLLGKKSYSSWTGTGGSDFRIITLPDSSEWTVKYHNSETRWVHFFPARYSRHTFRVKSNTLKSALFYNILVGKDFISADDLNRVRPLLGLSPVREAADAEAVTEMIEIIRNR